MPPRTPAIVLVLLLGIAAPVVAVDDGPVKEPAPAPPATAVSPERRYNEGRARAQAQDWRGAELAYREALRGRPAFPEAWNGLGYALRNQGKYEDAVRAYHEALRLRPDYPEALEYLGEAYVQMGRLDEAERLLERLRALNAPEARDLASAIAAARSRPGGGR
jgi:Flp pilus assembly protein TadD